MGDDTMENLSGLLLTAGVVDADLEYANASDNYTSLDQDLMNHPVVKVHFYALYVIIFVVGLLGNVLVVFVVAQNKAMQTVTNCFIANLALSDILLCVLAVPFTPLYFYLHEWIFGRIMCKLVSYSQGTSVYVSTLTLTSIAIDRFFVILYPFRPRMKMSTCCATICAIWIVALCATLPYGIFMDTHTTNNLTYCEESWTNDSDRQIFGAVTSVMQFVVPFIIMAFAYTKVSLKLADRSREKAKIRLKSCRGEEADRERSRRTNRMLIAMVTIFGASWLPINLVNLLNDLYSSMAWWSYYNLCFFLAHMVAMSSTCYNVFLYAWLNDNFRKELKRILPCFSSSNSATGAMNNMGTLNNIAGGVGGAASEAVRKRSIAGQLLNNGGGYKEDHHRGNQQIIQEAQILLPGAEEEGEDQLVDDNGLAVMGADVHHQSNSVKASVCIELTPLTYNRGGNNADTCPQCSTSTKTTFMTFDELADINRITLAN